MAHHTQAVGVSSSRRTMIEVRPAQAKDLPFVVNWYADYLDQSVSERVLYRSMEHTDHRLLIAEVGHSISGFAHTVWSGGPSELIGLAVASSYRGRGVARHLISALLQSFVGTSCTELWLEVRADNTSALDIYRRTGAQVTGLRPRYYRDGTDAVLMSYSMVGDAPSASSSD